MSAFLLDKVKNLQPTEAVSFESPKISSPFNESVMKTLISMVGQLQIIYLASFSNS